MCFSYAKPLLLGKSVADLTIGVTPAMPLAASQPFAAKDPNRYQACSVIHMVVKR
jgi:hypothetical protein